MNHKILKLILTFICLFTLIVGCGENDGPLKDVRNRQVDQALLLKDPALAFVKRFDIGLNLESIAKQAAKSTITYKLLVRKHGATESDKIISHEINNVIPSYQGRWDINLAKAYSNALSVDELNSLAIEGNESRYISKLMKIQRTVGEEMRKNASPILTELLAEAMKNSIK